MLELLLERKNTEIINRSKSKLKPPIPKEISGFNGRSIIVGFQESQSYQRFEGRQQEVLSETYSLFLAKKEVIGLSIGSLESNS